MKLYIVTLWSPEGLSSKIIKVFSTKENLDRWMQCAKLMEGELFGHDPNRDITTHYKIHETDLDNLDFVSLLAEARGLGAQTKPTQLP